jgi:hypothetical protein
MKTIIVYDGKVFEDLDAVLRESVQWRGLVAPEIYRPCGCIWFLHQVACRGGHPKICRPAGSRPRAPNKGSRRPVSGVLVH